MNGDETMDNRQLIETALRSYGFEPEGWREDEDGPVAVVGRFRAIEDNEDEGIFEGDEGVLTVSVAGAAEFANERACWWFAPDGTDGSEVRDPLEVLEGVS